MSPKVSKPRPPAPPKPWQRAEAGRYRSSDERFTLGSDGGGRWFVTDEAALDELGLARTTGPFPTLDAAKAAADAARDRPADASPLAGRLAEATSRPKPEAKARPKAGGATGSTGSPASRGGSRSAARKAEPAPPPRTWLDELADRDGDAARQARKLITALEREGIGDADALVRRDLLGDRPIVATRLLARDVLAAVAGLRDPTAIAIAEAVAGVMAASPKRSGLPGWELQERDGTGRRTRSIRLTAEDLVAAAEDATPAD